MTDITQDKDICIAEILTAHGVRGLVKLRCHLSDPQDIGAYNPLHDSSGKTYEITLKNSLKNDWVAEVRGVADRNEAERLRGVKLFVSRSAMPEPDEDEVYYEDLIGCKTITPQGLVIGSVIAVENFGAGDLLEIRPASGTSYYLPISEPFVQAIDTAARTIIIEPAKEFMNE